MSVKSCLRLAVTHCVACAIPLSRPRCRMPYGACSSADESLRSMEDAMLIICGMTVQFHANRRYGSAIRAMPLTPHWGALGRLRGAALGRLGAGAGLGAI